MRTGGWSASTQRSTRAAGNHAESAHADAGRRAAEFGVSQLLAVGDLARVTAGAAREAGLHRVLEFERVEALMDGLGSVVQPGDLVLLKASRRVRLERLLDVLCNPEARNAC